jgi:hypothetical protein
MTSKPNPSPYKEGSRKAKVHALYDKAGPEAAWSLGLKLKLSQNTLRSWFGVWRRESEAEAKRRAAKKPTSRRRTNVAKPAPVPSPAVEPAAADPEVIPVFLNG